MKQSAAIRLTSLLTLLIILLLHISPVYANAGEENNGTIRGKVLSSDGVPASSVTVRLRNTRKYTITDDKGDFILNNVPPGTYVVEISLVGHENTVESVTVESRKTVTVLLSLQISSRQLQEVIVSANPNKFTRSKSDDLAKMPLKNLENPQVYATVTHELMAEQQLTNFNDALRNVPGLSVLFNDQSYGVSSFALRGFATNAYLRNGVSGNNNSDIDPANIEKIEVLKGPSATLFGSTQVSWGGMINRATKKPYDHFGGEVSYTGGNFGLGRFTADINTPLKKDNTVLFRLNAAYTSKGSFQDAGYTKSTFLAPVITWSPNDRLTVTVEAEFYTRKATTPSSIYVFNAMDVHSPKDLDLDYRRSFTNNSIVTSSPATNFFGEIKYKLSDHWTSQTVASATNGPSSGPYLWNQFTSSKGDSISRIVTDWKQFAYTTAQLQQNFISDYTWGSVRNRLVTGIDFFSNHFNGLYFYIPFDKVSVSSPGTEYLNLTPGAISEKEASGSFGPTGQIQNQYTYAAYASDVLNITDRLIVNAALRLDRFENKGTLNPVTLTTSGAYGQTALSPKFGLVYQLLKDKLSVFGNYMNGFTNNTGVDFNGKPFKPSNGNQLEGGVKVDALEHRLSATLSYYNISAKNLLQTDSAHTGFQVQNGEERSRGFEVSVITSPLAGLNFVAGYSHNDTKYLRYFGAWQGLKRPPAAGPANTANLYISYHLPAGKAKGLGIGFGGNYSGDNTIASGFTLPSYTILYASVFYEHPVFRLGLKIDNLANQKYWTGYYDMSPQMPRQVSGSATIRF